MASQKGPIDATTILEEEVPSKARPVQPGLVGVFAERGELPEVTAVRTRLTLGRSLQCGLPLDSDRASREHATVEPAEGGMWVADLGSRNGTFVNGARLGAERVFASLGSVLRIGGTLLLVIPDVAAFLEGSAMTQPPLVGAAGTARLRRSLRELATSTVPVLLEGETGTGKEQAARFIHEQSGRAGAFVPVNCAAIPSELIESELFGHVRGAFSGASAARSGLIRSADRGTLLLDEVGDLPLAAQAKLLRVLEDSSLRPVGQDSSVAIDVRFVSATNRPLSSMIVDERFRGDLYHRIAAASVMIPPLRSRREDIPLLARFFLGESALAFSATAMERLLLSSWPGNVRQLRNLVQSVAENVRRSERDTIQRDDLPLEETTSASDRPAPVEADQIERTRLITALQLKKGNVLQVARELGMSRGTLYDSFRRLGIDPSEYRSG